MGLSVNRVNRHGAELLWRVEDCGSPCGSRRDRSAQTWSARALCRASLLRGTASSRLQASVPRSSSGGARRHCRPRHRLAADSHGPPTRRRGAWGPTLPPSWFEDGRLSMCEWLGSPAPGAYTASGAGECIRSSQLAEGRCSCPWRYTNSDHE